MINNEIVSRFDAIRLQIAALEKEKKALQTAILNGANGAGYLETEGFRVMIDTRKRTTIDSEAVFKDFPDFKDVYGKVTEYNVITVKAKETAM